MPAREPFSPRGFLGFAVLLFAAAAMLAWMTFLRYQGPRIEREARFMGCDRLGGSLWQLQFYPGPTGVRLEGSGKYDAQVAGLCARQARVRVVASAKGNLGEPTTWLDGLEDLESGEVVLSEEKELQNRRTTRIAGVLGMTFLVSLGLLMSGSALRALLEPSARPAPRGARRPPTCTSKPTSTPGP